MEKLYIKSPYLKEYNIKIDQVRNINNHIYAKLTEDAVFLGTNRVEGDVFTVDNKPCNFYKPFGKEYVEVSDSDQKFVNIKIDWSNRLLLMQENLALAILRTYIRLTTNFEIEKYKVSTKGSYIDLLTPDISFKCLSDLEELTNYIITANLTVTNNDSSINIDSLGEIDYEGPCLKRTGEIGFAIILGVEKTINGIRINMASGKLAYKYYKEKINLINNIKNYLNVKTDNQIFSTIKKLKS